MEITESLEPVDPLNIKAAREQFGDAALAQKLQCTEAAIIQAQIGPHYLPFSKAHMLRRLLELGRDPISFEEWGRAHT